MTRQEWQAEMAILRDLFVEHPGSRIGNLAYARMEAWALEHRGYGAPFYRAVATWRAELAARRNEAA